MKNFMKNIKFTGIIGVLNFHKNMYFLNRNYDGDNIYTHTRARAYTQLFLLKIKIRCY